MRRWCAWLTAVVSLALAIGVPEVSATDLTGIGYVDQAQLNALPEFRDAQSKLAAFKQQLDADYSTQAHSAKDADAQHALADQFGERFAKKQEELLGPLVQRAQAAIATIAQNLNLSVVVDRRILIVGGLDITADVLARFQAQTSLQAAPSSPPPSVIGYVDQQTIDTLPSVKAANDQYLAFQNQQHATLQQSLTVAKNDKERGALLAQAQAEDLQQQEKIIDPVVAKTRTIMQQIAEKRHLALVVDKRVIFYGGTDVTSDVQSTLQ